MKKLVIIGMAFFSLAGCKTLEDAVQQTINASIGTSVATSSGSAGSSFPASSAVSPPVNVENCGSPQKLLNAIKAARKDNQSTAGKKFDKWCQVSGIVTSIGIYPYGIWSYTAFDLDKKLACITSSGDKDNPATDSAVERSSAMLENMHNGQKAVVVGKINLRMADTNTSSSMLPLVHCRIVNQ